jgi:hypothetical protein
MDQIKSHRDLIAWQKAMELAAAVYKLSKNFPKEELSGLTSQLGRAAVSIPANIAEGQGRRSKTEFRQFRWSRARFVAGTGYAFRISLTS